MLLVVAYAGMGGNAGGGGDGEVGGGGGKGTAQTNCQSNPQPVPAVQPSTSSSVVQSLAFAAWQMASASAKVLFFEQCQFEPSSDPPQTEQPAFLVQGY